MILSTLTYGLEDKIPLPDIVAVNPIELVFSDRTVCQNDNISNCIASYLGRTRHGNVTCESSSLALIADKESYVSDHLYSLLRL